MIYYGCSLAQLKEETSRRGFRPAGTHDSLSEGLKALDDTQGSEATTVGTVGIHGQFNAVDSYTTLCRGADDGLKMVRRQRLRTAYGKTFDARLLVGQRIAFWTMNTFSPVMQLFFESGLSCTIEGGQLSGAKVGMDDTLRDRLTDLMHEEDGQLFKTTLPEKFMGARPAIRLLEAKVARRTSIAVKQFERKAHQDSSVPTATITIENHMVVGLRLEGMKEMGYVWASVPHDTIDFGKPTWGNVRLAGLVDDVVMPFVGFPQTVAKPGGQTSIVKGGSLIRNESI